MPIKSISNTINEQDTSQMVSEKEKQAEGILEVTHDQAFN